MVETKITLDDIRDTFDERTIVRGNDYYIENRVTEVKRYKTTSYKSSSKIVTLFSKVVGKGRIHVNLSPNTVIKRGRGEN